MADRNFREMLEAKWAEGKFVCVGLDSDLGQIPKVCRKRRVPDTIAYFNLEIVDATKDISICYKPNFAFYLMCGKDGLLALQRTVQYIKIVTPKTLVILDCKDADIGSTSEAYAEYFFEVLGVDAITTNPYLGGEALKPFLDQRDKGIIVLCRTYNPGAGEFQDLIVNMVDPVENGDRLVPLYQCVAERVAKVWNLNNNCGLVVGATYPDELRIVRKIVGDMPILIPGVGFQQKDVPIEKQVEQVINAGKDSRGRGMIINSSRGIIFASSGPDFAEAARRETLKLHETITGCLQKGVEVQ